MSNTKNFNSTEFYNIPLFESKNFKVIPSLGSLMEGWLLIIPKNHYLNMGAIKNPKIHDELKDLIEFIGSIVKEEYGDYIVFEHGPSEKNMPVGCGVDYAHIHIVPVRLAFQKVLTYCNATYKWETAYGIGSTVKYADLELPYLYFQDSSRNIFIGTSPHIPSQFFRKIIADIACEPAKSNWKEYFFLENIECTYRKLGKYSQKLNLPMLLQYAE